MRGPWAFLGRSKRHLELNFDQHGQVDETERLDFQKNTSKHDVLQWFSKVPKIDFGCHWGCFWSRLGGLREVFGACWALGGRLGGVLGVSGSAWER